MLANGGDVDWGSALAKRALKADVHNVQSNPLMGDLEESGWITTRKIGASRRPGGARTILAAA